VTLVAGISRELEERGLSASDWINEAARLVGGKGGGRKDLAQAGGKDPDKLGDALTAARDAMQRLLAQ
jgi:alanyl-tRNA synthetase